MNDENLSIVRRPLNNVEFLKRVKIKAAFWINVVVCITMQYSSIESEWSTEW